MGRIANLQAYRRYLQACLADNEEHEQTAWDAMPLLLRVRLCWQSGWLDAVFEVSPTVGRIADLLRNGRAA